MYAELNIDNGIINVKKFGAYGDGVHDDRNFINNAIEYIYSLNIAFDNLDLMSRYYTTAPTLYFPNGKYKVNSTLNINYDRARLFNIDGDNSSFISDNNNAIFTFVNYGGKSKISNCIFVKNYNSIIFSCKKLDNSKVLIDNCKFIENIDIAVIYKNRSSTLTFNNCMFSYCYKIFKNVICDKVLFTDCWFSEYQAEENDHTSFILLWGENAFENCMFIPNANYKQIPSENYNYTNLAWIYCGDVETEETTINRTSILLNNCRVSSEANAKTLINWNVTPSDENDRNSPSLTYIKILNCYQLAALEYILNLTHLPQQLIFENCDLRTANETFIKIPDNFSLANELTTYLPSPNRTRYTYDYSIINCKTQLNDSWDSIPEQLIPLFRHCDFDIKYIVSPSKTYMNLDFGAEILNITRNFNRTYLVKSFLNVSNHSGAMANCVGLLMFSSYYSNNDSKDYLKVDYIPLAQSGYTSTPVTINPTFNNGSDTMEQSNSIIQLQVKLNITNTLYNKTQSYMTIKPL